MQGADRGAGRSSVGCHRATKGRRPICSEGRHGRRLRWLAVATLPAALLVLAAVAPQPTEAPTGFDDLTNGVASQADFDAARAQWNSREGLDDGLGPTYNAQACGECHQTPVSGGSSQISELRAGRFDGRRFTDHVGGSLIQDRAIDASLQEKVGATDNVRTFRLSLSVLGDGYIEALPDDAITTIAAHQPATMRGLAIRVPVLEANGATRIARFGWKAQHASLLSFAADAYLNEMGITSPLLPTESTSEGRSVEAFDHVADPEDLATGAAPAGEDVTAFTLFMRSTKAPPRDEALAATPDAVAGRELFARIGCGVCHVADLVTAPAGTRVDGGAFVVPEALGNKRFHPYSDFLLHDIGTGDGIVQNGGPETRTMVRTPPLWGLRTRDRLMHDGLSLSRTDAILRHAGQARGTVDQFRRLRLEDRQRLIVFLNSL